MREHLETLCDGEELGRRKTGELFLMMVEGKLSPVEIAALLIAFRTKKETPEEIAGAAEALRRHAVAFPCPSYPYGDSCGTGGDGAGTINVSTAVALIAAEMGIRIAKHGNRSISSKCGSADLLEQLGVNIEASPKVSRSCLDQAGICFLFAPQYHRGLRHAMPVRRELRIRTMFNLLGPLVNPSRPAFQVMGVYSPSLCRPVAQVLGLLGCTAALVVHGSGLDEVAVHGLTTAALYRDGAVTTLDIDPATAGLDTYPIASLAGGEPAENARLITNLLKGQGPAAHEAVVAINAGALAWVAGCAADIKEGTAIALETIRSGRGFDRLQRFAELSHGA